MLNEQLHRDEEVLGPLGRSFGLTSGGADTVPDGAVPIWADLQPAACRIDRGPGGCTGDQYAGPRT